MGKKQLPGPISHAVYGEVSNRTFCHTKNRAGNSWTKTGVLCLFCALLRTPSVSLLPRHCDSLRTVELAALFARQRKSYKRQIPSRSRAGAVILFLSKMRENNAHLLPAMWAFPEHQFF